jgi:hypothetical protein
VNIQSQANNAKIYFGEKISSVLLDGDDGTKGNADLLKMMDAEEAQSDKPLEFHHYNKHIRAELHYLH